MTVAESPARLMHRSVLHAILKDFITVESAHVGPPQLEPYRIQVKPLELDEHSVHRPDFFAPCPPGFVSVPTDEEPYISYQPGEDFMHPMDGARRTEWSLRDYAHETLYSRRQDLFPWSARADLTARPFGAAHQAQEGVHFVPVGIADVEDGDKFPHVRGNLLSGYCATDDQLLWSEVVTCLRLVIIQLRRARFLRHMNAPVLLFSFVGPQHARVIEASFDGNSFLMRPTKLFDFREDNVEAFTTLTRWYVGEPKGDTVATA